MRPFFSYYGAKWRAASLYPAPIHDAIIEPFAGSAGYALRHHEREVWLIDSEPTVVATWRYLLSASPADVLSLPDIEVGQSVYDHDLSMGERCLIGWWLNHATTRPRPRASRWLSLRPDSHWGQAIRERIAGQLGMIRHWRIIADDYASAPDMVATWFIDPPYVEMGKHYPQSSTMLDYKHLANWCRDRQGQVMVCENEGATWLPFAPLAKVKATRGKSREVMYSFTTAPCGA